MCSAGIPMNGLAVRRQETSTGWKSRGNIDSGVGSASRRTWTRISACPRDPTPGFCSLWSDPRFPFRHAFRHSFTFWRGSDMPERTEVRTLPSRGRLGPESTCALFRTFPGEFFKGMKSSRTTLAEYSTVRGYRRDWCSASSLVGICEMRSRCLISLLVPAFATQQIA